MTAFINSLLEVSLISSVIILGLLLVSPLLTRKYAAKSLCFIWLLLALRLLVPLNYHLKESFIVIPGPVQSAALHVPANAGTAGTPVQVPSIPVGETGHNTGVQAAAGHVTADTALLFIWAAGTIVFVSLHFAGYFLLRRKIRRYAKPVEDSRILRALDDITNTMAIRRNRVSILRFPGLQSPMMTGFFRPVILVPDINGYEEGGLELIIRHELIHYKRKDIWFKLLLTCANSVHWFNPLIYLMVREADRQIENACDQELIKGGDLQLRKRYSESILSAMALGRTKRLVLSTYFYGGKQTMKQRFKNIFDLKAKKRGVPVVTAVIVVMLVSGLLVSCSANVKSPASPSGGDASASPSAAVVTHVTDTPAASDGATPVESTAPSASPSSSASLSLKDLTGLLGMTKEELTKAIAEKPVSVDEGGLGFDKTGIRVWFDTKTYTKVAQVLIMSDQIDIDGLKLGDSYKDFKAKFGEPVSDSNGDAHFKYGDIYLSVVRDTATDKTISVYILAEDF